MNTVGTPGTVTVNISALWWYCFARMWSDIGRCATTPVIEVHRLVSFLESECHCWKCRAKAALDAAEIENGGSWA